MSDCAVIWGCAVGALWLVPLAEGQPAASDLQVATKRSDAGQFVYLEHSGPYWSIGPLFTPVKELMTTRKVQGPIVVRFSADPTTVAPKSLRTQIGFFAADHEAPPEPFKSEALPEAEVAFALVPGPSGTTPQYYSMIREWIVRQGREPAGSILEFYPQASRSRSKDLRIEIQFPLLPADSPKPTVQWPEAAVVAEPPAAEPILPVSELVAGERWDRVAEQLMPTGKRLPASTELWLGQVIFRLGAIAKGLNPESAAGVIGLSDALMARYRQVTAKSGADPLALAVVRVDPASDPTAARKRTIMRDVDQLLGRVATKAADAPAVFADLTRLIQQIQDLLTESQSHP